MRIRRLTSIFTATSRDVALCAMAFLLTGCAGRMPAPYKSEAGPEKVLISARVELSGQHDQAELARLLRRLEHRIMENPHVGRATLSLAAPEEPDLD